MYLLLALAFASGSLMACPNLAGIYNSCKSVPADGRVPYKLTVTQKSEKGLVTYQLQGGHQEILFADGKERSHKGQQPNAKTPFEFKSTTTCVGEKVITRKASSSDGKNWNLSENLLVKEKSKLIHQVTNHTKKKTFSIVCE
ncbi:MAG TPA: hypothetical protein VNJ01_17020 [Bacteriovoracaceae bacterium]|nr:hypothetical protein [Bacteriovoracaceae bacterium]